MSPQGTVTAELEEEEEELEVEEEATDDSKAETKTTRERKRFHEDNEYVFDSEEKAIEHIKADKVVYEDDSPVPNLRVHKMVKGRKLDAEGEETEAGTISNYVIARSKSIACEIWAEVVHGTEALLARPMRRGSSGKRKIDPNILMVGKTLALQVFMDGDPAGDRLAIVDPAYITSFALFESGGEYSHYLDENRVWKEVPVLEEKAA